MSILRDDTVEAASDREIITTRVFDAQRELLFKALTDPDHLARWWGPAGFTNTFHQFDLRPGGSWRFVMHGPEGTDYTNESVFVEIDRPERIVFRHLKPMHQFLMTMLLAEQDGKARLTWRMLFESTAECDRVRAFAGAANEQNFDRLEAELATMA